MFKIGHENLYITVTYFFLNETTPKLTSSSMLLQVH